MTGLENCIADHCLFQILARHNVDLLPHAMESAEGDNASDPAKVVSQEHDAISEFYLAYNCSLKIRNL